jgi:hypothetical protein
MSRQVVPIVTSVLQSVRGTQPESSLVLRMQISLHVYSDTMQIPSTEDERAADRVRHGYRQHKTVPCVRHGYRQHKTVPCVRHGYRQHKTVPCVRHGYRQHKTAQLCSVRFHTRCLPTKDSECLDYRVWGRDMARLSTFGELLDRLSNYQHLMKDSARWSQVVGLSLRQSVSQ